MRLSRNFRSALILIVVLCITGLEIIALIKGVDGQVLSIVVGLLAGLAGYKIRELK